MSEIRNEAAKAYIDFYRSITDGPSSKESFLAGAAWAFEKTAKYCGESDWQLDAIKA